MTEKAVKPVVVSSDEAATQDQKGQRSAADHPAPSAGPQAQAKSTQPKPAQAKQAQTKQAQAKRAAKRAAQQEAGAPPQARQNPDRPAQGKSPQAKLPQAKPPAPRVIEVPRIAGEARAQRRHWGILLSFILCVLLPGGLAGYYMYSVAVDQYESRVGFAVRAEESQSALDVLSGLTGISKASSTDTDILYEFIQSKEMVQRVDAQMDLRMVFTRPEFDPVFALKDNASTEDLVDYWPRKVRVYYDGSTGLIEVRTFAFTREEALRLAELVFSESSQMINALSDIAREDATRYADEEREKAIERLIAARQAMTDFRIRTQIVDPTADIAGQMGLLNTLQAQLAEALIEQDLMQQTARDGDPRLEQVQRRIEVIEDRIAAERGKLGVGGVTIGANGEKEQSYAELFGEYERLQVDLQFAEATYLSALSAYDAAVSEAQRTSRYLTAYVRPTLSDTSTAPDRLLLTFLVAGFSFIAWFIGLLIYYSFRDRR